MTVSSVSFSHHHHQCLTLRRYACMKHVVHLSEAPLKSGAYTNFEWTNEWTDGRMNGPMNGPTDQMIHERTNEWTIDRLTLPWRARVCYTPAPPRSPSQSSPPTSWRTCTSTCCIACRRTPRGTTRKKPSCGPPDPSGLCWGAPGVCELDREHDLHHHRPRRSCYRRSCPGRRRPRHRSRRSRRRSPPPRMSQPRGRPRRKKVLHRGDDLRPALPRAVRVLVRPAPRFAPVPAPHPASHPVPRPAPRLAHRPAHPTRPRLLQL